VPDRQWPFNTSTRLGLGAPYLEPAAPPWVHFLIEAPAVGSTGTDRTRRELPEYGALRFNGRGVSDACQFWDQSVVASVTNLL
jgi:hypothetical protein